VSGVPRDVPPDPSALAALELAPRAPPTASTGTTSSTSDEPDPELLALPGPPRRERTLTLAILFLAAVSALAMAFALRGDVAYALSGLGAAPLGASVGDLRTATAATLEANENRLVRAEAMLGAAGGIRYERAFASDTFRTLPVAGRADVWVDLRVPAGQENGRWQPPRSLVGRLVRFGHAGPRHRGLAAAIGTTTHERVPEGAWLLVDGEEPESARWSLVLALAFLGFAVWNVAAAMRIVRRVD
jgi:hypothetical protein